MLRSTSALIAVGLTVAALATPATAKTKHRVHAHPTPVAFHDPRPPLEVNRRSFLDPGPVVPQGSMERYVEATTTLSQTPDQMFNSHFGNETLPRRFEIPARDEPLVEFWTPRY